MFYVVIERTQVIVEQHDTLVTPDTQDLADYYGEAVYIVSGQRDGNAEPEEGF